MRESTVLTFAPEHLVVVVHFEGTTYSFTNESPPLIPNPRARAIIRALLAAAIEDTEES